MDRPPEREPGVTGPQIHLDSPATPTKDSVLPEERFVHALRACVTELLQENNNQMNKLHAAVEDLKPKKSSTDTKTAFWNTYKTISDEFDKDYQQKYSTDLDTTLIFAGLFSAVTSAFIIQIQPEIQATPGTPATDTGILLGLPSTVLVAQCLLFVSLSATLLAALLAVLGKQWLMYYSSAGERGTIEARGLERQRKFDGLRRWKLDTIMQLFPLMLQFALLVFAVGLSVYLWTVHHALSIVVLSFTGVGIAAYSAFFISAVISPDSPFQSPLAPILLHVCMTALRIFRAVASVQTYQLLWLAIQDRLIGSIQSFKNLWTQKPIMSYLLPTSSPSIPDTSSSTFSLPGDLPTTSPEVHAVSWMLETTTDPKILSICAEIAVGLQWPANVKNLPFLMGRLRSNFLECLDYHIFGSRYIVSNVKEGMSDFAVHFGQAYCTLRATSSTLEEPDHWVKLRVSLQFPGTLELQNVLSIISGSTQGLCFNSNISATRWMLHILPSMKDPHLALTKFLKAIHTDIHNIDSQLFADYLFCLNSFLSEGNPRKEDIIRVNKSEFQTLLMVQLFKNLITRMNKGNIRIVTIKRVVETTVRLAAQDLKKTNYIENSDDIEVLFEFCRLLSCRPDDLPESLNIIYPTLSLTRLYFDPREEDSIKFHQIGWIYEALDYIPHSVRAQADEGYFYSAVMDILYTILCFRGGLDTKPPVTSLQILLFAWITVEEPSYRDASLIFTFMTSASQKAWFEDEDVHIIMQDLKVWHLLSQMAMRWPDFFALKYIRIGQNLVDIPSWHSLFQQELFAWITIFCMAPNLWMYETLALEFISVLRGAWQIQDQDWSQLTRQHQNPRTLASELLSQIWESFNLAATTSMNNLQELAKSSIWAAMAPSLLNPLTEDELASSNIALGTTILHVSDKVLQMAALNGGLKKLAMVLRDLGKKIQTAPVPAVKCGDPQAAQGPYWEHVWHNFQNRFKALEPGQGVCIM